jgi:hypothetical protein
MWRLALIERPARNRAPLLAHNHCVFLNRCPFRRIWRKVHSQPNRGAGRDRFLLSALAHCMEAEPGLAESEDRVFDDRSPVDVQLTLTDVGEGNPALLMKRIDQGAHVPGSWPFFNFADACSWRARSAPTGLAPSQGALCRGRSPGGGLPSVGPLVEVIQGMVKQSKTKMINPINPYMHAANSPAFMVGLYHADSAVGSQSSLPSWAAK